MKNSLIFILLLYVTACFSQSEAAKEKVLLAEKKSNTWVYYANNLLQKDFISAEMDYRKAISEQATNVAGNYNLGSAYVKAGVVDEAQDRLNQTIKIASNKAQKHFAYHNLGNAYMENKKCKEAVEAYKNALRNNPSDNETRYNLALAKICAEQQKNDDKNDQNDKDKENKDNKDQNKDKQNQDQKDQDNKNQDNKDQDQKDQDQKDQDKKEGDENKDDKGKPKEDQDKNEDKQPQQGQGKLSPEQIKSLLEAMTNEEQKTQEKMNAEKTKGAVIRTEKDW